MSGKLIVRRDDGRLETVQVPGAIKIGAQNDLRVDVESGEYWIRDAGAALAVNGERVSAKRKLRHLDVITVGENVNAIFSTATMDPPSLRQPSRVAVRPGVAESAVPQVTMTFRPAEIMAPDLGQGDDEVPVNTQLGIPAAIPAFKPAESIVDSPNTLELTRGAAPVFQPPPPAESIVESPNTLELTRGAAAPKFPVGPQESAPAIPPAPVATGPVATGPIATGPIPPSAPPKFQISPDDVETVMQPRMTTPPPRPKPASRVIYGVEFKGLTGVLNAPSGKSVIGRGTRATIRIDSERVSKVHAVVDITPTEVIITDQNSVNGTTVNGQSISKPQQLKDGDRVSFGSVEFRVTLMRRDG